MWKGKSHLLNVTHAICTISPCVRFPPPIKTLTWLPLQPAPHLVTVHIRCSFVGVHVHLPAEFDAWFREEKANIRRGVK